MKKPVRAAVAAVLLGPGFAAVVSSGAPEAASHGVVITLLNRDWHRVIVEVKRGKERPCQVNLRYGTRILKKGEAWSIPCEGERICRRLRILGFPETSWGPWHLESCSQTMTRDVP